MTTMTKESVENAIDIGLLDETQRPFFDEDSEFNEDENQEPEVPSYTIPYEMEITHPEVVGGKETLTFNKILPGGSMLHFTILELVTRNYQLGKLLLPLSEMTGWPQTDLKKLAQVDMTKAIAVVTFFFDH